MAKVTEQDWRELCSLSVSEEQIRFVAYNSYSLAQACFEPGSTAFSIYHDRDLVGFALIQEKSEEVWIVRLMIDQRYQGKGYGRDAVRQLCDRFSTRRLMTSFVPENRIAKRLYESAGFSATGELVDGEIVMERRETGASEPGGTRPQRLFEDADGLQVAIRICPPVTESELSHLLDQPPPDRAGGSTPAQLTSSVFHVCAYDGDRLIGFAKVVSDGGSHGFLLDPTVDPGFRRKGIGRRLVEACVEEARGRGMEWLHVDYEPHLQRFYEACGFFMTQAGLRNLLTEDF